MRYVVVLDTNTHAGRVYKDGVNDGETTQGLPIIDCSEIDEMGPYLRCTRNSRRTDGLDQSLWIPHHAVAYVVGYALEDRRPVGFSLAPDTRSSSTE